MPERDLRWWHRPSAEPPLSMLAGVNPIELVERIDDGAEVPGDDVTYSIVTFHDLPGSPFAVRDDELHPYIPVPVEDPVALEQWLDV